MLMQFPIYLIVNFWAQSRDVIFQKSGQKRMLFPKLERLNLRHYKYELRPYEFGEYNLQYIYYCIYYYGIQRIDQLMVGTVVRLQFSCDEHHTKFQHHENLSLLSSHRSMNQSSDILQHSQNRLTGDRW